MKCPIDGSDLVMAERQGVEIDYCSKCRGIWLDRGELDKIIERSEAASPQASFVPPRSGTAPQPDYPKSDDDNRYGRQSDDDHRRPHNSRDKKRKSFLGELFDFD
jgi:Zn-finger nucleic acid-binding protein